MTWKFKSSCEHQSRMGRIFRGQIRPRLCEIPPRKGLTKFSMYVILGSLERVQRAFVSRVFYAIVAQLAEHLTFNQGVVGSIPIGRTTDSVLSISESIFYLILVIPSSFDMTVRSISYRKQQGFVSWAYMQRSYNG